MILAIDTETHLIAPAQLAPRLVCLSYCDGSGAEVVGREDARSKIERWLTRADAHIVGCNIAFDMGVLCAAFPDLIPGILAAYEADRIGDVALNARLNDIAAGKIRGGYKPYSLASLAERFLGVKVEKEDTWRLHYAELDGVPLSEWPAEAIEYARKDADVTLALYREVPESPDSFRQARAALSIHLASCWGMRTDPVAVARLEKRTKDEIEQHRAALVEAGLLNEKGKRSIKAARARMLEVMGGELYNCELTEKGAIKVDRETCEESGDPLLKSYARYTKLQSLTSGAIKDYKEGTTMPIHTTFNPIVYTGRMSSQKPNLQNIRREPGVRECFVPRAGCVYLAADVDRAELHTLAQVCKWKVGYSELGARLNAGEDPHLTMGARLLGISAAEAIERAERKDPEVEKARQAAKVASFGFPGGLGVEKMVDYAKGRKIALTLAEARELHEAWKATWPCIVQYLDWIGACTKTHGHMTVEQCMSGRLRGKTGYTNAANSFFQGLAADAVKACCWEITKRTYNDRTSALYGARLVNVIHDEFLLEVKEEAAPAAGDELAALVVEHYSKWTPDYPISCSPLLMRRWVKAAHMVRDGFTGELKVWGDEGCGDGGAGWGEGKFKTYEEWFRSGEAA